MLALPAEAGGLGQGLLHHRRRVDEDLHAGSRAGGEETGGFLQLALDHVVIVAVAGIDRDGGAVPRAEGRQRVGFGPVIESEEHDAAHLGPQDPRVGAPRRRVRHPGHGAVMALRQPGLEAFGGERRGVRGRHADDVEAEGLGALDESRLQKSRSV